MRQLLAISLLIVMSACERDASQQSAKNSSPISRKVHGHADGQALASPTDGTHLAAVKYYNPQTSYRATYQVKVEVRNGQVNKINFPTGSYLNEMQLDPEQLDETGTTTLYDNEGREFGVEIVE